jgi:hypothetical protein
LRRPYLLAQEAMFMKCDLALQFIAVNTFKMTAIPDPLGWKSRYLGTKYWEITGCNALIINVLLSDTILSPLALTEWLRLNEIY